MKRLRFVFLLWVSVCGSAVLLWAQNSAGEATETYLPIYFAWENPCELCHDDAEFYEFFIREISDIPDRPLIGFNTFNTFKAGDRQAFDAICAERGIARVSLPVLIIGDEYLEGTTEIHRGARDLYVRQKERQVEIRVVPVYSFTSTPSTQPAVKAPRDFPVSGPDNSILVCFVTSACENCEKARALLGALPSYITLADGTSSPLDIYYFNVAEQEGLPTVRQFFSAYGVPNAQQLVPIVFYAGGYLAGHEEIEKNLNGVLVSGAARGFVYPGSSADAPELAWRELPAIFLAGLVGGINPCSVSMLLLLLSLLAAKSGRILPLGLTYVVSRMLTYLALGFGLFSLGQVLNQEAFMSVSGIIRVAVIVLSLLLCALNLADFVNARRENYGAIKVQLPAALRRFNHRLITRVSGADTRFLMLGIFFLGVAVSAGEFLCTGQIYLATILYLLRADSGGHPLALAGLLCYTLAASIPPTVLVIFCYRGKQALALSEFARQKMPLIKL
ncbi:MAG: sulfite exporter TauE/SafE family protein, partial [Treponema sp.]|nr:sulfite exporter TauE/SafE family protein [Treponema sp.]